MRQVFYLRGTIEHFCESAYATRAQLFVEWFLFARCEDAVITARSTIGYTAFSRRLRLPITIDPYAGAAHPSHPSWYVV